MGTFLSDPPVYAGIPPDMPTVRLGSDPNGVVWNASQGFGGAACPAIVNAREKPTNLNGGGSLDLSRKRIQSPKRARRAVSEVRTVPANPFENTENSALCMGVAKVRKGDVGGEGGIRTHGRLSPTPVFETGPIGHSGTSPLALSVTGTCAAVQEALAVTFPGSSGVHAQHGLLPGGGTAYVWQS
jgi:hypothetical protein